jgi:hypothetical protein
MNNAGRCILRLPVIFKKQNSISSYMFIKMMNTQQIKYND